ncbi:hypothetical protein EJB05_13878, partial [Eragrostis curvula]
MSFPDHAAAGTLFPTTGTPFPVNGTSSSPEVPVAGPYTQMMAEDIDVEALDEIVSSQTNVEKERRKRQHNYKHDEDIQLCISWETIGTDPIVGNEQPRNSYWNRIAEHYHDNKSFTSNRNANSLEHRWSTIQKECMKFQADYEKIERHHKSGIPHTENMKEAQAFCTSKDPNNKTCQFIHCWLKVRHVPKFQALCSNKRSRKEHEGVQADEGGINQTLDSSQEIHNKRPMGRKQAKEKEKEKVKSGGEQGPYKDMLERMVLAKERETTLKEERWSKTLKIQQERLSWEREMKIMFCDANALEPYVKTYVLAERKIIAAQKVAELNAAASGT